MRLRRKVLTYVRREALERVALGQAVDASDVASVLSALDFVDALTWSGERIFVERRRFDALWCPSPRREVRAHREVRLGDWRDARLYLVPSPAHVFVPSWSSLAAVRRALAGYGLRLGKITNRTWYGPPRHRYLGTTWSVRGNFREPAMGAKRKA